MLLETTAAGWDTGMTGAPHRDWRSARLGPEPPEALATVRRDTFEAVLAATGTPPSLFTDADGTAQREAFRRYLTLTVAPLGRLLAAELTAKLETPVSLDFASLYAHDLVGRASAFQRLVSSGLELQEALAISGLLGDSSGLEG